MNKTKLLASFLLFTLAIFYWQCTFEQEPLPETCLSTLSLSLDARSNSTCGANDGTFTVSALGGEGNYSYSINGGVTQGSSTFNGLAAGTYIVTVFEGECFARLEVQIQNTNGVNATVQSSNSNCGTANGSVLVSATGGAEPYQYKLGSGSFQSSASFNDLAPGNYQVTVKDGGGCEVNLQAKVTSEITFDNIKSIIETNCAVSGCHNGSVSPNFTNNSNIVSQASRIQARTSARTMPPASSGRSLTAEEIESISCWVSDGASGN